jgi:hypothetical protein
MNNNLEPYNNPIQDLDSSESFTIFTIVKDMAISGKEFMGLKSPSTKKKGRE